MRHISYMQKFCILFVAALTLLGCKENIDTSARYVFKYETVMSYLQKHEAYSEYVKLIELVPISSVSESTVAQLLAARGRYTVFAPTNEAIAEYLQTVYEENPDLMSGPTWDDFFTEHKRDSIRLAIVHNSIIDSGDHEDYYEICNFPTTDYAEFPLSNLMDHKLSGDVEQLSKGLYIINGKKVLVK